MTGRLRTNGGKYAIESFIDKCREDELEYDEELIGTPLTIVDDGGRGISSFD